VSCDITYLIRVDQLFDSVVFAAGLFFEVFVGAGFARHNAEGFVFMVEVEYAREFHGSLFVGCG